MSMHWSDALIIVGAGSIGFASKQGLWIWISIFGMSLIILKGYINIKQSLERVRRETNGS